MSHLYQPARPKRRGKAKDGSALVVLNWGAVAWYRSLPMEMAVGELLQQLARELGRDFDGKVVGLELLSTGTSAPLDLSWPLRRLTNPPYRNVCLDVIAGPRPARPVVMDSLGERLLRKHMTRERFQAGIEQRLWRLIELAWPKAVFEIRRSGAADSNHVALRLNFEKYPLVPPQLDLWDIKLRRVIEARNWPEFFIRFVTQNYPRFVDLPTQRYSFTLLRISAEIARQLKPSDDKWDSNGDLTQMLTRAANCFDPSDTVTCISTKGLTGKASH